jgi:5-methylcytosine-specific restriction endonuclease McrA
MKKLDRPSYDARDVYKLCIAEANPSVLKFYKQNYRYYLKELRKYETASNSRTWFSLDRVPNGNDGQVIIGSFTKKSLTKLYSNYMLKSKGDARDIYDKILVSAGGKCPSCGGIGHVKTLDHYLPKANFPVYSVLPLNLIPACRDCNIGKSNKFPTEIEKQNIHPYIDDNHFFNERWIFADIVGTDPITVQFKAVPPLNWSQTDRDRASSHFQNCDLALRYSTEVGAEITYLIDLRKKSYGHFSSEQFKKLLSDMASSDGLPLNGWRRTLYDCLSKSAWFYNKTF